MTMKNKIEEAALSYGKKENCPAPNENPYITKKCEEAITVHFKRGASFALSELVPLLIECRELLKSARFHDTASRIDATLDGIEGEK